MSKSKNRLFVFLVSVTVILISFLILEFGTRAYKALAQGQDKDDSWTAYYEITSDPGTASVMRGYNHIAEMEYNSYLAYIPKKSIVGVTYKTNSNGFRNSYDITPNKPSNEKRIFVTGGSAAWGAGVNQDQVFTNIMEKGLSKTTNSIDFKVINAAAGAYCSTQERITVENRVIPLKPDVVVMFTGWNDIYFGYVNKDILENQDWAGIKKYLDGVVSKNDQYALKPPPNYNDYYSKAIYLLSAAKYWSLSLIQKVEREDISKVVDNIAYNISIVSALCKQFNYKLVVVLQPCPVATNKALSPFEKTIVESIERPMTDYYVKGYKALREGLQLLSVQDKFVFIDADVIIADTKETIFIDAVHMGSRGNLIIGNYLANVIHTLPQ